MKVTKETLRSVGIVGLIGLLSIMRYRMRLITQKGIPLFDIRRED